jgi:hypothetical protein
MTTSPDVNFEELARSTDEFNGAQLRAVCVEAGMIALREGAKHLTHEHFLSGIAEGTSYINCFFLFFVFNLKLFLSRSAEQEEERSILFRVAYIPEMAFSLLFFDVITTTAPELHQFFAAFPGLTFHRNLGHLECVSLKKKKK